jgi:hypothetical protein
MREVLVVLFLKSEVKSGQVMDVKDEENKKIVAFAEILGPKLC